MAAKHEYYSVTPVDGGLIHITDLSTATKTACNRSCVGWRLALVEHPNCHNCKLMVGPIKPVTVKKRRRARGRGPAK